MPPSIKFLPLQRPAYWIAAMSVFMLTPLATAHTNEVDWAHMSTYIDSECDTKEFTRPAPIVLPPHSETDERQTEPFQNTDALDHEDSSSLNRRKTQSDEDNTDQTQQTETIMDETDWRWEGKDE